MDGNIDRVVVVSTVLETCQHQPRHEPARPGQRSRQTCIGTYKGELFLEVEGHSE